MPTRPLTALEMLPPYSGTDVAGGVLLLVALLLAQFAHRDREPGLGPLALAFAALGIYYLFNERHLPVDERIAGHAWQLLPSVGLPALAWGMVDLLRVDARTRRWLLPVLLLPPLLCVLLLVLDWAGLVVVVRQWPVRLLAVGVAALGVLAMSSARREPHAGHAWIGAALIVSALLPALVSWFDPGVLTTRYWTGLGVLALGLTVMGVVLLRRRRALQAEVLRRADAERALLRLNEQLEAEVAARTHELHDLVLALESFNRNVSHDLRGPLGGIAGAAELVCEALQRGDAERAQRLAAAIATQARVSTELIEALLQLARVGDAPMATQSVDLQALAHSVVEQARLAARAAPFPEVRVQADAHVQADPGLTRAALANLLANALKFSSGSAPPQISIEARQGADGVRVTVRDNGVGFDPARAAALFKPFQRLHGRRFEGQGLGLSIVRRAVERQGGRVWAESREGEGASFHFTLPAPAARAEAPAAPA